MRITDKLGPGWLVAEVDGRPLTVHSQPTFARDTEQPAQATIPVYLPAGSTWRPVRGMRVWLRLSDAALAAIGGGAAHRSRFTGRVSDVGQVRRRDGALVVTIVATGTRPQLNRTRVPPAAFDAIPRDTTSKAAITTLAAELLRSPAWTRPVGHSGTWGLVWAGATSGGSVIDAPRYWTTRDTTWGALVDTIVASNPKHLLTERRDGGLVIEETTTAATTTVPASLVAQPLEQQAAPLVNSVRVVYGQARYEPDLIRAYQTIRNPNPEVSQSKRDFIASANISLTAAQYGVDLHPSTAAAYSAVVVNAANPYDGSDTYYLSLTVGQVDRGGWQLQACALPPTAPATPWTTIATTTGGAGSQTVGGVYRVPPEVAGPNTTIQVQVRIPAHTASTDGARIGSIKRLGATTLGHQAVSAARMESPGYFDGGTPADNDYRYYWLGGAHLSMSVAEPATTTVGSDVPRRVAQAEDTSTWTSVDQQAVEVTTALGETGGPTAGAIARALLVPAQALRPPTLTIPAHLALRDGRLADLRAILATEIGYRVKVTGAPTDVDTSITTGTGAVVTGITETLTDRSWVINLELDRT